VYRSYLGVDGRTTVKELKKWREKDE